MALIGTHHSTGFVLLCRTNQIAIGNTYLTEPHIAPQVLLMAATALVFATTASLPWKG